MDIESILKLEKTDPKAYEESLKIYRDLKNVIDTSFELGRQRGYIIGKEIAHLGNMRKAVINLFKNGVPICIIAKAFDILEDTVCYMLKDAGQIPENSSL